MNQNQKSTSGSDTGTNVKPETQCDSDKELDVSRHTNPPMTIELIKDIEKYEKKNKEIQEVVKEGMKKNTILEAQLNKIENEASIKMKNMEDLANNRNPDMQLKI